MLPIHKTKLSVFNYDEIPAGYYHEAMLHGSPVQKFWHNEKFLEVIQRIPINAKVLDLGCGPGSFLDVLGQTQKSVQAVGIDMASKQIAYAQEKIAPKFAQNKISFQTIEVSQKLTLPFADASFDTITSIEVIEHLHPYIALKMLEEAMRVLKPDGKLLITTPNYRSFWPLIEFMLELMSPVKYHEQHISKFTPSSLVKFVESAGLKVISLESIFIFSPFFAPISQKLAKAMHILEKSSRLRLGSLLIIEAQKINWD